MVPTGPNTPTVKLQELLLPLASVAVHVTVVVPMGKVLPEGGTQLIVGWGSQVSVAVAVKVTLALEHWPGSTPMPKLPGQVIDGAIVSRTVTVKLQKMRRPLESVALYVTVVSPTEKVLPDAGV